LRIWVLISETETQVFPITFNGYGLIDKSQHDKSVSSFASKTKSMMIEQLGFDGFWPVDKEVAFEDEMKRITSSGQSLMQRQQHRQSPKPDPLLPNAAMVHDSDSDDEEGNDFPARMLQRGAMDPEMMFRMMMGHGGRMGGLRMPNVMPMKPQKSLQELEEEDLQKALKLSIDEAKKKKKRMPRYHKNKTKYRNSMSKKHKNQKNRKQWLWTNPNKLWTMTISLMRRCTTPKMKSLMKKKEKRKPRRKKIAKCTIQTTGLPLVV